MTGDMLFKQSSTLICWPDGSLAAYLESLERLRATVVERNVARLLTAHGPLIDHPLEAIDRVYRHRLDRLERVRAASIRPRASTSKPSWNTSRSPASCRPERRRRDRVSSFDSLALRSG